MVFYFVLMKSGPPDPYFEHCRLLGNAENLKDYIHPDSDKEESIMYADVNEALQKMMDKKWNEGHISGVHNKAYQAARNMYNRGFLIQDTASLLEEPAELIRQWYQEWDKKQTEK